MSACVCDQVVRGAIRAVLRSVDNRVDELKLWSVHN